MKLGFLSRIGFVVAFATVAAFAAFTLPSISIYDYGLGYLYNLIVPEAGLMLIVIAFTLAAFIMLTGKSGKLAFKQFILNLSFKSSLPLSKL